MFKKIILIICTTALFYTLQSCGKKSDLVLPAENQNIQSNEN